ncbi:hypothetical protein F5Y17DRAFT_334767 [Xylariaceae sp. FL0594]|nr:hypothetical protein F5Y17DRAFT_334767 [Xylariaceae sp. FL0594]
MHRHTKKCILLDIEEKAVKTGNSNKSHPFSSQIPTCNRARERKRSTTMAHRHHYTEQSTMSQEDVWPKHRSTTSNIEHHPRSSKATTYFTWSTSHYSSHATHKGASECPSHGEPAKSQTPDSMRRALIATGVYRNTGIVPYDTPNACASENLEEPATASYYRGNPEDNVEEMPCTHEEDSNATQSTIPIPACLEQRWKAILPSEWRLAKSPVAEGSVEGNEQRGALLDLPTNTLPISQARHREDEGRLTPRSGPTVIHSPVTESQPTALQDSGHNADDDTPDNQDQASVASRELMPPPPVPPRRPDCDSSMEPTSSEEQDCAPWSTSNTTRLPETPGQLAQSGHPEWGLEPALHSPDKVSWIPQAMVSNTANLERDRSLSRLSTRSPLYESQYDNGEVSRTTHNTPPPVTCQVESMAEYIRRIESEVEDRNFLDAYADQNAMELMDFQPSSRSAGNEQNGALLHQPSLSNELRNDIPSFIATDDFDLPTLNSNAPCRLHEEPQVRGVNAPTATPVEEVDFDAHDLEMSMFWRANQFSYI